MIVKNHNRSAAGLSALLLAVLALALALAAPALAGDEAQGAKAKQIMMVFTTDANGELNPCG